MKDMLDITCAVELPGEPWSCAYSHTWMYTWEEPEVFWRAFFCEAESMQLQMRPYCEPSELHWFIQRPYPLLSPEDF